MKRISFFILTTFIFAIGLFAQNKINQYEYWFDTNFSGRTITSIAPVQNYQLNTAIQTTGLSTGLHTFHVRFKDENNACYRYISLQSNCRF